MRTYSKREPSEYNWLRTFFQWIVVTIGYANIFRITRGYKVLGRENLPKNEFYIVASNHTSAIDPFIMCHAITKPTAYMAKKELFDSFWSRLFMDLMGAFAVDREKLQVSTIKTALGIKKTKWVLALFPQGTRELDGNLDNVNRGFAGIAKTLKCPIVPVGIVGASKNEYKGKNKQNKKRLICNIGKPIPFNPDTEEMVKVWSEKIVELTDEKAIEAKFAKPKKNYARKYARDFNFFTRLYQLYAIFIIFKPLTCLFYNFKIEGRKNIQKGCNYIFAPNHLSYLDPFVSTMATGKKQAFMAKKELFEESNYLAKNISRLGAFAVNREKPEASAIKSSIEAIRAKWSLCIFPQGGIRKNKKIEDVNKGFIALAKKTKVAIIPIGIEGLEHYNWNPFKRTKVNVKIGTPISYLEDEEIILEKWSKQVCNLTGYTMGEN